MKGFAMKRCNMFSLATALLLSFIFVDIASAYHNPRTGRFLSRDPIGEPGAVLLRTAATGGAFLPRDPHPVEDANPYHYVRNMPPNAVDPFGLQSQAPGGIRKQLNNCIQHCKRIQPLYPWWSGWSIEDCIADCNRTWLTTNFWSCSRDMNKEGADCGDACAIGMADFIENHGFISHGLGLDWAYTLRGDACEKKGTLPQPERGFPGKDATCSRCYLRDFPLKHGSGAGKKAYDATVGEIKDCIKNAVLRADYNAFTYNCNDWVRQAQRECGLYCPKYDPGVVIPGITDEPGTIPGGKR